MPQSNWDKSIEDFCSSEKEIQELQEVASLLCGMQKAQSSPLFRDNLKARLMEKSEEEGSATAGKNSRLFKLKTLLFKKNSLLGSPVFSAAAVVLLIVAVTFFYNQSPTVDNPEIANPSGHQAPETYISSSNRHYEEGQFQGQFPESGNAYIPPGEGENGDQPSINDPVKEVPGNQEGLAPEDPEAPEGPEETAPETGTETGTLNPESAGPAGPGKPGNGEENTLKEEPEFEAWKNGKVLALGGKVKPASVYYSVKKEDNPEPADNTRCTWEPRKYLSSAPGEGGTIGTETWAKEILLNEGFMVKSADQLQVNPQETQKGIYAEIIYKERKSSEQSPALILLCGEKEGILSYYYQEQGGYAEPGFYRLLSPAQAFKNVKDLQWYTPQQRMSFSFQEVSLTYHEFEVEENGGKKTITLPAYCYVGTPLSNGDAFKVYVPAI